MHSPTAAPPRHIPPRCEVKAVAPWRGQVKEGEATSYQFTVVNVGDSRALLLRANGQMEALTADHKPNDPAEVRHTHGHAHSRTRGHGVCEACWTCARV